MNQLYVYPIKSLRGTALKQALVTRDGFLYDRTFMLLKVETKDDEDGTPSTTLKNMHIPDFPAMGLFFTNLIYPNESTGDEGKIIVTYQPPASPSDEGQQQQSRTLDVPLQPSIQGLEELHIVMWSSPTNAYNMGAKYNDWFSECFGYPVVMAYLGENRRPVLGTVNPYNVDSNHDSARGGNEGKGGVSGWLSSLQSMIPWTSNQAEGPQEPEVAGVTFVDCAAYLVISETSVSDVSARIGNGEKMDKTKFRPNIIVSGAETAWEEDFWGELTIGSEGNDAVKLTLTANCPRCRSLNVDFATGKHGKGPSGEVLKKLMKDRRIDKGLKYIPIFGRYGFLDRDSEPTVIQVGDSAEVTKTLPERTVFVWPGVG